MKHSTHILARRVIAGNKAATDTALAAVYAANIAPISSEEWVQLAPYGRHVTSLTNRALGPTVQVFEREHAEQMVTEFNSLVGRLGRAFRGAPVYVGHPDLDIDRWPDESRLGKVVALEARGDGIYGRIEWNTRGQENQREGFWVYPSIVWSCEQIGKELHPRSLRSVGLTNEPNIDGVAPVTANASVPPDGETKNQNTMPPWLIEMLGLAADATEDQIKSAITSLVEASKGAKAKDDEMTAATEAANAAKTRITELEGQLTAANTAKDKAAADLTAANTARAALLIEGAIRDGRADGAEKDALVTAFNASFDTAAAALAARKPKVNTKPLAAANRKPVIAEAAERMKLVQDAVSARMQKNPHEDYITAFNAVEREMPEVFAAMKGGK